MRLLVLCVIAAAVCLLPLTNASATDVADSVWGQWTVDGSPYYVIDEIWIPSDSTLIIDAGVDVIFWGHYKFRVEPNACLKVHGTEGDSVTFRPISTEAGWHGIRFTNASPACSLSYAVLTYGKATSGTGDDLNGGAIWCSNSSPDIFNCRIDSCTATTSGGAIYLKSSSNPAILDNLIRKNSVSSYYGGGIYCSGSSYSTVISGNTISNNWADDRGGGIYCTSSDPTITGNSIVSNGVNSGGGGIYCYNSNPTIRGNRISYNTSYHGGGINLNSSSPEITANIIDGNSASRGGGIYFSSSHPTEVSGNTICGNTASSYHGGGIYCSASSPVLTGNTICENWADDDGGGIGIEYSSSPTLLRNEICSNYANYGGGIAAWSSSNPVMDNNVVCNNTSGTNGAGIYLSGYSQTEVNYNNSIYGNSATGNGGGIYLTTSDVYLNSNILWSNTDQNGSGSLSQIYLGPTSEGHVTYSDVQGGWPGDGNINDDPDCVLPEFCDLRLLWISPCIDTGDPDSTDTDGTRRDMGAHFFDQTDTLTIYLTPADLCGDPVVHPGDTLDVYYTAINRWDHSMPFWLFTQVTIPNGMEVNLIGPNRYTLPSDFWVQVPLSLPIPEIAPLGEYDYWTRIGMPPATLYDEDRFTFTVE